MQTYRAWLQQAIQQLTQSRPSENHRSDALLLLQKVTKQTRSFIIAFDETLLKSEQLAVLDELLQRRITGEPMAYIFGEKEFWSLNFKVSKHTLIPRPDTEILVEQALMLAQQRIKESDFSGELSILDLGTGTGAIALALASELTPLTQQKNIKLNIIGLDRIPEAVNVAQENAKQLNLQASFIQSSWFEKILPNHQFDLIVSNPPYIDEQDPHLGQGDVRFEPHSALIADEQGYADLRHIIAKSPFFLKNQGYLLLEHGWQQAEQVRDIFHQHHWANIQTIQDYGHNDRVTFGCFIWNT
ncbi:peptide chain release factor N(5)-glutamine methyltransferase [[Haemophilus] felis]|uniref:Release factor glutamine methyltransferase n=1 Tax=[Haemophilus] felis TaxID=123822 RepID=A0A1T0AWM5_9PAST|nr:peptide chain release factor N(5)-glutamine methyltransferase [[Haemophilus] felis]NBI41580.1 peptide chain release factor N(5)-glutamine methyltransferase [[Haemophilus] felis]NBI42129.1 peptide chain release factor N(5)-glutamine methyltransferase [[Haemophilus] felis]OOS02218.1 protein-(glutamine-N5) methyltransferase, release factor-specific [[Haemophilus] felis]